MPFEITYQGLKYGFTVTPKAPDVFVLKLAATGQEIEVRYMQYIYSSYPICHIDILDSIEKEGFIVTPKAPYVWVLKLAATGQEIEPPYVK